MMHEVAVMHAYLPASLSSTEICLLGRSESWNVQSWDYNFVQSLTCLVALVWTVVQIPPVEDSDLPV